jgi:N-acetylglucosamine-6-sulfatase
MLGSRPLVLLVALAAVGGLPVARAADMPNIILIVTDDQRTNTIQYMPTVQRELVAKGVAFAHAHVVNPVCCPSRASLLTGTYSHTNGVYGNQAPDGGFAEFDDRYTLATVLQHAGYRTSLVGKYLNGYGGSRDSSEYIPPGWSDWHAITANGTQYYNYDLNNNGYVQHYADQASDYETDVVFEHAQAFAEDAMDAGEPFFSYIAPEAPHNQAVPEAQYAHSFDSLELWRPPSYSERNMSDKPRWMGSYDRIDAARRESLDDLRRRQLATLQSVDEDIAQLLHSVDQHGQLGNTIIIYTSDNGYFWGEHRVVGKNLPYEEATQIPFILRYDAEIAPRTDTANLALIDVAPTLAGWAGTTMQGSDGMDVRGYLEGTQPFGRAVHLIESHGAKRAPAWCMLRGPDWSFTHYSGGVEEYYDLDLDPFQLRNRAQSTRLRTERHRLRQLCHPLPPGMDW